MPILIRPVREQLEHDRVIRLLQAKWKKKYEVEANVGDEQQGTVKLGQMTLFPDLVLNSQGSPRQLQGVVEVETGESVNNLEAMAEWVHYSRAKAPFHLYVPAGNVEQARRLCGDLQVAVAELWSYFVLGDQIRFTLVHRDPALAEPPPVRPAAKRTDGGGPHRAHKTAEAGPSRPRAHAAAVARAAVSKGAARASDAKRATRKTAVKAKPVARTDKGRGAAARKAKRPPVRGTASKAARPRAAKTANRARPAAKAKTARRK